MRNARLYSLTAESEKKEKCFVRLNFNTKSETKDAINALHANELKCFELYVKN
jgi:hypothetical protein